MPGGSKRIFLEFLVCKGSEVLGVGFKVSGLEYKALGLGFVFSCLLGAARRHL